MKNKNERKMKRGENMKETGWGGKKNMKEQK